MKLSFLRLGWRTLLRDLRAGELRLLMVAVTLAVAALTSVGFFADRLQGGLQRDAIGRIQIRETFSLIELPEDGLERLLGKLKDTRVSGKALKLRRYRED